MIDVRTIGIGRHLMAKRRLMKVVDISSPLLDGCYEITLLKDDQKEVIMGYDEDLKPYVLSQVRLERIGFEKTSDGKTFTFILHVDEGDGIQLVHSGRGFEATVFQGDEIVATRWVRALHELEGLVYDVFGKELVR